MLNLLQDTYNYLEEQHNCLKHVCALSTAREQKYRSLQCRLISQIIQELKVYSGFYMSNNMALPVIPQDESLITITQEIEEDKSFQYSGDEVDSTTIFSNYESHDSANEPASESDVSTKEEFNDGFSNEENTLSSNVFESVVMATEEHINCDITTISTATDTDQSKRSMEINTEVEFQPELDVSAIEEELQEPEPKDDIPSNTQEESGKILEVKQDIEEAQIDSVQQRTSQVEENCREMVIATIQTEVVDRNQLQDASVLPEDTGRQIDIEMENPPLEEYYDTPIENKAITGISKPTMKRTKKKKELKCRKCKLGFEDVSKFTEHLISHRGKEQKPKRMPTRKQPDAKNKSKEVKLTKPKGTVNPKEIIATCPTCNKQFKYAAYFISHKCAHLRRPHKKKYRCEVCKKLFGHRSNLVTHKRIHSGEKPYKCDLCDGEFKQKSHLQQHYRKHTGEKPYQCDICCESFVRNSILLRHVRNKHS